MGLNPLTSKWLEAVGTGSPAAVTNLYAASAVLLPTVSPRILVGHLAIEGYFVDLMKKPGITVTTWGIEHVQRIVGGLSISGNYSFTWNQGNIPARYTFVWAVSDNRASILTHHSSAIPRTG